MMTVTEHSENIRTSLAERARKKIENDILDGKLRPHQRLVENEIAGNLGLSRGPVREALKQLEVKGLVTRLPSRGLIVSAYSFDDVKHTFEVREILEQKAIQMVCDNITQKEVAALKKYLKGHQNSVDKYLRDLNKSGSQARMDVSWSALFHANLYRSCGNPRLIAYIEELRDIERLVFVSRFFRETDYIQFHEQHLEILNSIGNRDKKAAMKAVEAHLNTIRDIYLRYI